MSGPLLFALRGTEGLGAQTASRIGVELSPHEERRFSDGEHKSRPLCTVRGRDVYVLHSLHRSAPESVDDRLIRLLFFCGALREASARSVTAVTPYLCYGRADRQTTPRDPVITRYVAMLLEAMGVDRVVAVDVHDLAAFQNGFRCQTEHLSAAPLFVERIAMGLAGLPVCVVAPDAGGAKRANVFRRLLSEQAGVAATSAYAEKARDARGEITGELLAGDVEGRMAVVFDDMIASGGTMLRAARRARAMGARSVVAVATHGVFTTGAEEALLDPVIDRVLVTDSITPPTARDPTWGAEIEVVGVAALLAAAIARLEAGESLVPLATPGPWIGDARR